MKRGLLKLAIIPALGITLASAASAGCPPDDGYAISNAHPVNRDMVAPEYLAPGMDGSIALQGGKTISSTFGGALSSDVNGILAEAKVEVNHSITRSLTTSVTYTGHASIPSSWSGGGYIHAGAHADTYNWKYWEVGGNCRETTIRSGSAMSPATAPAFWTSRA